MERNKYCIFACGGHGTRMGADIPKQFLRIGDKTILQLSLERICRAIPDIHPIIVLPEEYITYWQEESRKQEIKVHQTVIAGGFTRFHSVKNALARINDSNALVAVHDGVRPLVSEALVQKLFETAEDCDAAIPVTAVTDTLKVLRTNALGELEEIAGESADRSLLFGAQTPQVFRFDILKASYELPFSTSYTDDASVARAAGYSVKYIPGERYNIKITTTEDLAVARILCAEE